MKPAIKNRITWVIGVGLFSLALYPARDDFSVDFETLPDGRRIEEGMAPLRDEGSR